MVVFLQGRAHHPTCVVQVKRSFFVTCVEALAVTAQHNLIVSADPKQVSKPCGHVLRGILSCVARCMSGAIVLFPGRG